MTRTPDGLTRGILAALGVIAAVGPFATDMYLASFTDIATSLGTSPAAVQLTLTAFLLGMGSGQLLLGPLSDRFGRRAVLLTGVAVFAAAGAAMAFAPSIEVFVALRLLQGFAGAAGVVLSRAIVVDLSPGLSSVRALSLLATIVGLGPLIAPPIGGLLATLSGWRGVLGALALISIAMLLLAAFAIPESLPPEHRHTGGIGSLARRFATLLRDRGLVMYMLAFGLAFGALMSYISASPFVGQTVLGMSPLVYSLTFAGGATALIGANLLNARLAPRVGPGRMLAVGVSLAAAASAFLALLAVTGTLSAVAFVAGAFVATGGAGLTMSNASALALARTDHTSRGSGAALLGATQFLAGGVASPVVGLWGEHTAVPMALSMLTCSALALALAVAGNRLHGRGL